MRFQIQYGLADYQKEYRNSLIEAVKRCEHLARQGYTVALTNPDTGFHIQSWN